MPVTANAPTANSARVEPLSDEHRGETLAFLGERPLHTVILAGLLREHGASVPAPRGTFYGCRNRRDQLEGVALVGRATMFEARTGAALAAFAALARQTPSVQMIMGEEAGMKEFWSHYAAGGRKPRIFCHDLFYEFTRSNGDRGGKLRQATLDDLEQIVSAHAEMVREELGVNPLDTDPDGFRQRCAQRVGRGKVWALIENGDLIFKADVVTETPEAAYLEGVWVRPDYRREGYGRRCWKELSSALLERLPSFCGFVNAENSAAHAFYDQAGGTLLGKYDKVYL
jgi:ribosomal protein S18 acetylase RimI-like enzyme